jgi:uncharacterized protein with PQ loop repeat
VKSTIALIVLAVVIAVVQIIRAFTDNHGDRVSLAALWLLVAYLVYVIHSLKKDRRL